MKEIGGYFELEGGGVGPRYHEGAYLNSGRNALRYIVQNLGIHKIHVPYYTCPVVFEALKKDDVQIEFYDLDSDLMPAKDFPQNDFVIYNNYFGVCGGKVKKLTRDYPNLIVDNAQAFYSHQIGRAAFYSPRKFFGLPDGGIACGIPESASELPKDESWNRMSHLLKRLDLGASAGYEDFKNNSRILGEQEVKQMSKLTETLLDRVDCQDAARKRKENYRTLDAYLHTSFPVDETQEDVPMVYPLVVDNADVRRRLIEAKIFVASYWPGLTKSVNLCDIIIPLPIDQRYNEVDMLQILRKIDI